MRVTMMGAPQVSPPSDTFSDFVFETLFFRSRFRNSRILMVPIFIFNDSRHTELIIMHIFEENRLRINNELTIIFVLFTLYHINKTNIQTIKCR